MSNMVESPLGRLVLAGTLRVSHPVIRKKPRIFGSYAIAYVVEGRGLYSDVRGTRRTVSAGDLIVVFPDVGHHYGPRAGETWEEIYLVFAGPLFDLLRRRGVLDTEQPVLRLEPVGFWFRRIAAVAEIGAQSDTLQPGQVIAKLHALLADIVAAQRGAELPSWVKAACQELEEPDRVPDWTRMARRAHLSRDAFRKKFTKLVGTPPARYRMAKIMEHASTLLHDTDLPQREIARLLGFADEFQFSKAFKRHLGFPPSTYRNRVRGSGGSRAPGTTQPRPSTGKDEHR